MAKTIVKQADLLATWVTTNAQCKALWLTAGELWSSRQVDAVQLTTWVNEGKLLALPLGQETYYADFLLGKDNQPLPVLKKLREGMAGWPKQGDIPLSLWLMSCNGWLGEVAPYQRLASDLPSVLHAMTMAYPVEQHG